MSARHEPPVSVLTPAYNRGEFLAECIESVLEQTYSNWHYTIVDNCSTDATLEIATRYAATDHRIRVCHNDALLDLNANHNYAFSLMPPASKYCKIVSADDWLFPDCLERMVGAAEANPTVGIVGAYQLSGGGRDWRNWSIRWGQIPYPSGVVAGTEICRLYLLSDVEVFGSPTSLLYRADMVRKLAPFFSSPGIHADTSACCRTLQETDYAFVHQVLSFERVHEVRVTTECQDLNSYLPCKLSDVLAYGGTFLTSIEQDRLIRRLLADYYGFLAIGALKFRDRQFWNYHEAWLKELGYPLRRSRLAYAIGKTILRLSLNPTRVLQLAAERLRPLVGAYLAQPDLSQLMRRNTLPVANLSHLQNSSPPWPGLDRSSLPGWLERRGWRDQGPP